MRHEAHSHGASNMINPPSRDVTLINIPERIHNRQVTLAEEKHRMLFAVLNIFLNVAFQLCRPWPSVSTLSPAHSLKSAKRHAHVYTPPMAPHAGLQEGVPITC